MRKNALLRAFALFLAFIWGLLLPGCSTVRNIVDTVAGESTLFPTLPVPESAASATAAPTSEPSEEALYRPPVVTVPFPQMVYERPDVEAMTKQIRDAASELDTTSSEEKALTLLGNVQNTYDDFRTAETLAMIHNSIDYSDAYWQQEFDYCTQGESSIQEAMTAFNRALSSSKVGQDAGLEPSDEHVDAQILTPLLQKEAEIKTRYNNHLATATATYEGTTFAYAECASSEMLTAWMQQNAPALADLFLQLLDVRDQIAKASGFGNYIEYIFYASEVDYTPQMMTTLLENVAQQLGPLFQEVSEKGIYATDMRLSVDDVFADLETIFNELDPELTAALDFMRQYELYDFSNGANKEASDYTTYIVNYAAPFIQVTFDGSWDQTSTIINEFGHFFNYTQDEDASYHSLATLEIFSEALELISTNFYSRCFSEEDAYMMTYNALANTFTAFPYQGYLSAFEYEAYTLSEEERTYENLCAISQRQWERFGFEGNDPMGAIDWTTVPHLFDTAFYSFSYILAGDVAMQLWETSQIDPANAMQIYMTLMNNAKDDMDFLENVEAAGLISPFATDEMATLAGYFRAYLIYETGIYGDPINPILTTPVPSQEASEEDLQPQSTFPISEPSGRFGTFHGYTDGNSVETYGDAIDPNATPAPTPTPVPTRSKYNSLNHGWENRSSYAKRPFFGHEQWAVNRTFPEQTGLAS